MADHLSRDRRSAGVPELRVDGVTKVYAARGRSRGRTTTAVDDVSFTIEPGAAVGLVGASGSGKTTLARLVTASERPTTGSAPFQSAQHCVWPCA